MTITIKSESLDNIVSELKAIRLGLELLLNLKLMHSEEKLSIEYSDELIRDDKPIYNPYETDNEIEELSNIYKSNI